jgi:hypothetical protein
MKCVKCKKWADYKVTVGTVMHPEFIYRYSCKEHIEDAKRIVVTEIPKAEYIVGNESYPEVSVFKWQPPTVTHLYPKQ